jgi:hypothetical protein
MKNFTQKLLKNLPYLLIAILVGATAVYATPGSKLTPSGPVSNTMYSLTDIWNLATGTTAIEGTGAIETTPSLAETGKSLTDVYTAISGEIAKLTPSVLLSGNTIFGVEGEATAGVDTSDADATAEDIISPKTAYVNGVKLTGTAVAGTPAPTFASADQTTYNCSSFTTMTDPTRPSITSADICGYNTGCSWNSGTSQCDGGEQTGQTYMTWYAGKASCASSTEGGQTAGTWRLPTYGELVDHYVNNNQSGGAPLSFQSAFYWSSTTYPSSTDNAYVVGMGSGDAFSGGKYYPLDLARCAH